MPVQYGGLSRPSDLQNGPPKPASEFAVKGGEKVNIQIEGIEVLFHSFPQNPDHNLVYKPEIQSNFLINQTGGSHNLMGHCSGRLGIRVQRRVRSNRRWKLHNSGGETKENFSK